MLWILSQELQTDSQEWQVPQRVALVLQNPLSDYPRDLQNRSLTNVNLTMWRMRAQQGLQEATWFQRTLHFGPSMQRHAIHELTQTAVSAGLFVVKHLHVTK